MRFLGCTLLLHVSIPTAVASESISSRPPSNARKPNIIFILADDLGYGDLGCYGQKRIETPCLDRMASEGLQFTQAYAGGCVCAPSRCVLMTGLHIGHAHVRGNKPADQPGAGLQSSDVTIAKVLHDDGYETGLIGKWGLGEPLKNGEGLPRRQGFDYFFGYLKHGHAHNYYPDLLWRNESIVKLPNVISLDPALQRRVAEKKVQYSHDLFVEEALDFIQNRKNKPFFLCLAFTIPHANNEAGASGMEVPDYAQYEDLDWPDPQKGHAAMISRMDRDIGKLFTLLERLELDEETLVIFASDNGPHREGGFDPDFNNSNGPLRGYKGNLTEGGIRVPMIARWPSRITAGKTIDSPVYFADVMPTLASICGAEAPAGIDGVNFSPTLLGRQQPELSGRFMYWEWNRNGLRHQAARWFKWKALHNPHSKSLELYDLTADVGETHNLASKYPDITARFVNYFGTARTENSDWPKTLSSSGSKTAAATAP